MPKKVPYLQEEQIERDAAALLAEFAQTRSVVITPPIPIEDIVEKYLKLGIEFDDMHRLLKYPRSDLGFDPDILGAIWRRIVIDESLDPEENPSKEGRYRFTLAHEGGGHWRLHRHLFAKDPAQVSLFNGPVPPSVVCRSSQAKPREKRRLLNFVLSNCSWDDGEVVATFRQPFDLLAQTTAISTRAATNSGPNSAKSEIWLGN